MFGRCMYALVGIDSKSIIGKYVEKCVPFYENCYQCLTKSRIVCCNGIRIKCTPNESIFQIMLRGEGNDE